VATIVGRDAEMAVVRRFLDDASGECCALHLHGPAGIGKSTIWQAALSEGEALGFRVSRSRPTEAEATLPFSGLTDLFGDLLDEVQPELPEPQRRALDIALLRASVEETRPDPLAISLAVLNLLRVATTTRPIILAVDDVPWLDRSSATVLDFALRRLEREPVGILVAQRTTGDGAVSAPLASALPAQRVHELGVEPLTLRDIDALLAVALNVGLPHTTLSRIFRASGGNPFYAIEIARALQRRGGSAADGELHVPATLTGLVRDRLEALSPAAERTVAHAAALSQPSIDLLEVAVGRDVAATGLADAAAAGVVTVEDRAVHFTHPLLAGEAYARLRGDERHAVHRRLASVVREPEEHARHLALATPEPDEVVARVLEEAANRAGSRGALAAAAELAERAVSLTPERGDVRIRRRLDALHYRMLAGELAESRPELVALIADAPSGDLRARALVRLGEVHQATGEWQRAGELFAEALGQVTDVRLEIEIKLLLGGVSYITGRDRDQGAQHVADAMHLAEALGDPAVLAGTIGHHAIWQYQMGNGVGPGLDKRVAELEPWTGHLRAVDHPFMDLGHIWYMEGRLVDARVGTERLLDRAERNGDYSSLPILLSVLADFDFMAGNAAEVLQRLHRAERLARATSQGFAVLFAITRKVIFHARWGDAAITWSLADECGELVNRTGVWVGEPSFRSELAVLELSRGDPAAADRIMTGEVPWASRDHVLPALQLPIRAEALVSLGRLGEARAVLDDYERDPPATDWRLSSAARAADARRSRALLEAAEGELDSATRLIGSALETYQSLGDRWEEGRARLIAGDIHRRARRRAEAKRQFAHAKAIFTDLRCVLWAGQVDDHLERLGSRRRAGAGLTPTQLGVAELAIEGLTNRHIAERLFMSVHTVEAHLSAAYQTLDIRSRRELAAALRRHDDHEASEPAGV
jgi:DNA-binding CsgD family transcriptional regulator